MDEFFQRNVETAADLRTEIFTMLGRMDRKIMGFSGQYHNLCSRQKQDLADHERNGNLALKTLKDQYEQEKIRLVRKQNEEIRKFEEAIRSAEKKKADSDRMAEEDYRNWEVSYQQSLDQQNMTGHQANLQNTETLSECRSVRESVKNALGKNLYDQAVKGVVAKSCQSASDARTILNRYSSQNRTKTENEILRIHNSVFRRLFFSGERNRLCRTLEQMTKDLEQAVSCLCRQEEAQRMQREREFEQKKKSQRDEVEKKKKASEAQLSKVRSQYSQSLAACRRDFSGRINAKENDGKRAYGDKARQLKQEYDSARKRWEEEKRKALQIFYVEIEADFPAVRLNEAIRKIWNSQRPYSVREFGTQPPRQTEAERNVIVGEIYINVRRWYEGESGAALKQLMIRRYGILLRKETKNGTAAPVPEQLRLPFTFSLEKGENLILRCPDQLQETMEQALHAAAMRILWAIPAGQSQFLLGDPDKIGSFAGFASLDPAIHNANSTTVYRSILDGNRVWSSAGDIRQQIADNEVRYQDISRQMGSVSSLREHNLAHPMNQRSFQITMVQKFPFGMDETSLQNLRKMGADCGKMGYSSILSGSQTNFSNMDPKLQPFLKALTGQSLCLQMRDRHWFTVQNSPLPMEKGGYVVFYPCPDTKVLSGMKQMLRTEMEKSGSNTIVFEHAKGICPPREERFRECADAGIVVPIGYLDGGEPCRLVFDDTRVHMIINGDTGSGKTNLLHVLITNTLLRYSPEEVQIYLIDFKHGTEFARYAGFNLPGIRALSICNEPEFALQVLRMIEQEQSERVSKFGSAIANIKSYNQTAQKRLPRIIVILDELYELVLEAKTSKSAENVREEIMQLIKSFAIQARAYGIHMVISGQNLTKIPEINGIKESCNTRIALRCSEQQAEALMGSAAKERMRLINDQDKGACVVQLGKTGNPLVEHTAYMEEKGKTGAHIRILKEIHDHYCAKRQYGRIRVLTADVHVDPNNIFQRYLLYGDVSQVQADRLWLGEWISTNAAEGLSLQKKNLWISGGIGEDAEKAGRSLMFFSLLSLLLQRKKGRKGNIYYGNGEDTYSAVRQKDDRAGETAVELKNQVIYGNGDQICQMLQSVSEEMMKRKTAGGAGTDEMLYLLLERPEERIAQNARVMQMLQEILLYGPALSIHTILWTRDSSRLAQMQISSFPATEKLLLEMESTVCQNILGRKSQNEPKGWSAISGSELKLRVYNLPAKNWVEKMILKLR